MTIIDSLLDRQLLGAQPGFRDLSTWSSWLVLLSAIYGLPLTAAEQEAFRRHSGRLYAPPAGGFAEAIVITGRQSGKTRIGTTIAAYEAMRLQAQRGARELHVLLVAQDHRGAMRTLLTYVTAAVEASPLLSRAVEGRTADSILFESGPRVGACPCRPAAIRGLRAAAVIIDELAFFISTDGRPTDTEMLRAVRPTLATTGGKLIVLSSPYAQTGALWELHRKHYGRGESPTLVWEASAPEMNPTLPADYLERMATDDPEAYRSEVLGEFRAGIASLFDPEALDACVSRGVRERPPAEKTRYHAFVDPSGGRGDSFTVSVAHADGETAVIDCVRAWRPPFNPSGVIEELVEAVLRPYRVGHVTGDKYGAEFCAEQFRKLGIEYRPSPLDRSGLYLALLPRVNAGAVRLLDHPQLLRELRGLERRRGSSGRDRVDHRPGAHDDTANAAAGAVSLVAAAARHPPLSAPIEVGVRPSPWRPREWWS